MDKIIIRKPTNKDTKHINTLFKELICYERMFSSNIVENISIDGEYDQIFADEKSIILLAEVDNKVIGFIYGYEKELDEVFIFKEAFIEAIYVQDKYRQQGIGKKLMLEFETWCKKRSIKYVDIEVMSNNKNSLKMYEKIGYNLIKKGLRKEI